MIPSPHDLVHRALVSVNRFHHPLENWVEDLAGLLWIAVGEQLHRALQIGKQHGHLLALAFEGALGREDLLGEVLWSIGLGRSKPWLVGDRAANAVPHLLQNLDPAGRSVPHELHVRLRRAPHSKQKLEPVGFSCWHRGHFI
jgi:hypothetical protein